MMANLEGARIDELNEELDLAASCNSKAQISLKNTLLLLFKISSLELDGPMVHRKPLVQCSLSQEENQVWQLRNTIKAKFPSCHTLPYAISSRLSLVVNPETLIRTLSVGLLAYLTLQLNFGAYFLLKQDELLKELHLEVIPRDAPRTDKCALKRDLHYGAGENSINMQKYRAIQDWLVHLGVTVTSLHGIGLEHIGIISLLPLAYHYFSFISLKLRSLRVDHMSFLMNPLAERCRIRTEVNSILDNLIVAAHNYNKSGGSGTSTRLSRGFMMPGHFLWPTNQTHGPNQKITTFYGSGDMIDHRQVQNRIQSLSFIHLLMEVHNSNLVRPANLESGWYMALSRLYKFMVPFSISLSLFSCFVSVISLILYDIIVKANHRVDAFECAKWMPNGVLIKDFVHLNELDSLEDQTAYATHDGSSRNLIYLALIIEARYYFTWRVIWFIMGECVIISLSSVWTTCFVSMFLMENLHNIVWLNQLEKQINASIDEAIIQSELRKRPAIREKHQETNKGVGQLSGSSELNLARQMTVTYINFELFRRQQKYFKPLANFLSNQGMIFCASSFVVIYLVAKNVDPKSFVPALISLFGVLVLMNVYLIVICYKAKRMEKFVKAMFRLVIHASKCWPKRQYHILDLWRRELLTDAETKKFFSSNLLGTHLSYQKLISFNAYVLALCALLLRLKF